MYRIPFLLAVIFLLPITALANNECAFSRDIEMQVPLLAINHISVETTAGNEVIQGTDSTDQVIITGTACASSKKLLSKADVTTQKDGSTLKIHGDLPMYKGGGFLKWNYAYIDLKITIPNHLALTVDDSRGSVSIHGMKGGMTINDSAGALILDSNAGPVSLHDSSGNITVRHHHDTIDIVTNSSGNIHVEDIQGSVNIHEVSSGSIVVHQVSGDVWIGSHASDGIRSGRIDVTEVAGSFTVDQADSNTVHYEGIAGIVSVPSDVVANEPLE